MVDFGMFAGWSSPTTTLWSVCRDFGNWSTVSKVPRSIKGGRRERSSDNATDMDLGRRAPGDMTTRRAERGEQGDLRTKLRTPKWSQIPSPNDILAAFPLPHLSFLVFLFDLIPRFQNGFFPASRPIIITGLSLSQSWLARRYDHWLSLNFPFVFPYANFSFPFQEFVLATWTSQSFIRMHFTRHSPMITQACICRVGLGNTFLFTNSRIWTHTKCTMIFWPRVTTRVEVYMEMNYDDYEWVLCTIQKFISSSYFNKFKSNKTNHYVFLSFGS